MVSRVVDGEQEAEDPTRIAIGPGDEVGEGGRRRGRWVREVVGGVALVADEEAVAMVGVTVGLFVWEEIWVEWWR